jgi:hypothetical protein
MKPEKITPYEIHHGKLGVKIKFLQSDREPHPESLCLISYKAINQRMASHTSPEKQLRRACKDLTALIEWDSINRHWQSCLILKFGEPKKIAQKQLFEKYYVIDVAANRFYRGYIFGEERRKLSEELIDEYTMNASVLNALKIIKEQSRTIRKNLGEQTIGNIWPMVTQEINEFRAIVPHTLPPSQEALRKKYAHYEKVGYKSLISLKLGTSNACKIARGSGKNGDWLLAMYCLPTAMPMPKILEEYNLIREAKGWQAVTEQAVNNFLHEPAQKRIWMYKRHGLEEWKNEFGHTLSRDRSRWFPNVYWSIDGTKLDLIYLDTIIDKKTGKERTDIVANSKINIVFDIYSEKILGWSLSETENMSDHFTAVKMAFNTAGCRPFLFTYDNQSGHKSKVMQDLYTNMVAINGGTHYPHQAYRHSSPVEGILNRLQKQHISTLWYSDKQSIKVRNADNRPNMDFIMANKHLLKTKAEVLKIWETIVYMWNNAEHPKFKNETRNAVYQHEMKLKEEIDYLDQSSLFWVNQTQPITYFSHGIKMKLHERIYEFEVYDSEGLPDSDFRANNITKKFIIKYDPEYLDQFVKLYQETDNGLVFVATAEKKKQFEVVPALMHEGEKALAIKHIETDKREIAAIEEIVKKLVASTGVSTEKLIEDQDLLIKYGGKLPKNQRNELEKVSYARL